jgi:hypothetical protein
VSIVRDLACITKTCCSKREDVDMRSSRFIGVLAAGACVALTSTGFAGDSSQSTFVNPVVLTGVGVPALTPPVGPFWANGVSKGKTKGDDKCKVQAQLSGVSLPDTDQLPGTGDEVICTADASVSLGYAVPLSTTAVFRGEVKAGKVKIKADLFAEGTGCIPAKKGGPGLAQYNGRMSCYAPDAGYPAPPLPFASDPTQGVFPAGFAPRPASPLIATQGLNFAP